MHNQSKDGSWGVFGHAHSSHAGPDGAAGIRTSSGFTASGDAQRSPRALSLLQWCYSKVDPLDNVKAAINKSVHAALLSACR